MDIQIDNEATWTINVLDTQYDTKLKIFTIEYDKLCMVSTAQTVKNLPGTITIINKATNNLLSFDCIIHNLTAQNGELAIYDAWYKDQNYKLKVIKHQKIKSQDVLMDVIKQTLGHLY